MVDNGDGTFKASYVPDDCGQYKVNVKYGGKEVPHAPFSVTANPTGKVLLLIDPKKLTVYNRADLKQADKCKITEGIQEALTIGEEYCISVNAKNAGNGAVTCRIRSTSGRYRIWFLPSLLRSLFYSFFELLGTEGKSIQ